MNCVYVGLFAILSGVVEEVPDQGPGASQTQLVKERERLQKLKWYEDPFFVVC